MPVPLAWLAAAAAAAAVTTPIEAARFVPLNPAAPDGVAIAVLQGDPATGPSDMLMRMPKGQGVPHIHTHDYRLVIVEGTMIHAAAGEDAGAQPMGPGGYWFQPGGQPHVDHCLSDRCTMFITWSGKRDARRAE